MMDRAMRIFATIFVLAALGFVTHPAQSQAQSFGFSIASGGGHHHHHHRHCGGWSFGYGVGPYWGPAYYAPPAVIYAPPPVVQERVIYVQPPPPAPLPPNPYSSNSAAPNASLAANGAPSLAGSTANDDRIVVHNAAGARLPVSFLVDGQDVELNDGGTRTFVGRTRRTIQYDRGGRFGSTQQDLTGGQYEFRITASGWDLVRKPDLVPSSRTAIRSNSLPEAGVSR